MNLGRLESRILHRLEDGTDDPETVVQQEINQFEYEVEVMSPDPEDLGQARLTDGEIRQLPMGNQHTKWNVIRWQCVKAAAIKYDVPDWTSKVDRSLTYEENIDLMRQAGDETTTRELQPNRP